MRHSEGGKHPRGMCAHKARWGGREGGGPLLIERLAKRAHRCWQWGAISDEIGDIATFTHENTSPSEHWQVQAVGSVVSMRSK